MTRTVLLNAAVVLAVLVACAGAALVTVSREAEATFPAKNGRIAFCIGDGGYAIASVSPDGSGYSYSPELSIGNEWTCQPAFSPDGTKLAFSSDADDYNYDIYGQDLTTGQLTQLTKDGEEGITDVGPRWSPDGKEIIFSRYQDGSAELWAMDADGSNMRRLTDPAAVASGVSAQWSPDGSMIAFVRESDVWVMDADGSDEKNLTRTPDFTDSSISWSPNGRYIAWAKQTSLATPVSTGFDIWKMRADGSKKVRLTSHPRYDGEPVWSPDGKKIAFVRDADNPDSSSDRDIWKMKVNGSRETNVTNTDWEEFYPDWQSKPLPKAK